MTKEINSRKTEYKTSERMLELQKKSKNNYEKEFLILSMLTLSLIPIPTVIATIGFTFTGGAFSVALALLLLILTAILISKWNNFYSLKIGVGMGLLLVYSGLLWVDLLSLSFYGSSLSTLIAGIVLIFMGFVASLTVSFVYNKHLHSTTKRIINMEASLRENY